MKTLPKSWTKSQDKQLSFADTLFAKPAPEDILVDLLLTALKDAKFLRYRVDHSKLPKLERLKVYHNWNTILEMGAVLVYKLSRKSPKLKGRTQEDFMMEIFVNKIDWPPTEQLTRSEIIHHHDNTSARITGILLAHTPLLKKVKREVKVITENLLESKNIIHRLL